MKGNTPSAVRAGHILRWLAIAAGLCALPIVILGVVAVTYLIPYRDASALRHAVADSSANDWSTKVQLRAGPATLGAIDFGLRFVRDADVRDARAVLGVVKRASVGVYVCKPGESVHCSQNVFDRADRAMLQRGWVRLVGVAGHEETVLIYVPEVIHAEDSVRVCLAVVTGKELVVASSEVDTPALMRLLANPPERIKERLKIVRDEFHREEGAALRL